MSHIFISYSRKDMDLAQRIVDALAANKLDTWIDWKSIPKGEDWRQEIYRGIEGADAFLYLVSPDSVASAPCNEEIEHAVRNGKRILPIVLRDTKAKLTHPEIAKRNWIFCRDGQDDFKGAIEEIRKTIHTDYEWLKYHTKLQVKALDWEQHKDHSRLLRGKELREAEEQFTQSHIDPQPTDIQRTFILNSRKNEELQRRRFAIGLSLGFVFMAILAVFAWVQRNNAVSQRTLAQDEAKRARTGELSALALSKSDDLDLAILLGIEAYSYNQTPRSIESLYAVTQDSYSIHRYLNKHTNWVHCVIFTADMKHLLSGSADGTVLLWDLESGTPVRKIYEGTEYIRSIDIDPTSKIVAIGDESGQVYLVDYETGKVLHQIYEHRYTVTSVAFSPDGKLLASAGWDNTVTLSSVATGELVASLTAKHESDDDIWDITFDPNGDLLVAVTGRGYIVVWDLATHQVIREFVGHSNWAVSAEFSPDGKLLATGGIDKKIVIWNTKNNFDVLKELSVSSGVWSLKFAPDGNQLFAGGEDQTIHVWNTKTWEIESELKGGHSLPIRTVDVSPNGQFVASAGMDNSVVIWSLSASRYITKSHRLNRDIESAAYARKKNVLAIGTTQGEIYLWELNTDRMHYIPDLIHSGTIYALKFDPEENVLVSGSYDSTTILWDWRKDRKIRVFDEESSVAGITFDPTGQILATTDAVGNVSFWDLETYEKIGGGQNHPARSIEFNPNGKNLAIGDDSAYTLLIDYENQPGDIMDQNQDASGIVMDMEFSMDGSQLAVGSATPSLLLFSTKNNLLDNPMSLDEHKAAILSLAFSPDGKSLVSGSDDGNIILWDTNSGTMLGELSSAGHESIVDVDFTADGSSLVIVGRQGNLVVRTIALPSLIKIGCEIANRNLTRIEWMKYFPNQEYRATCPNLPIEPEVTITPTP